MPKLDYIKIPGKIGISYSRLNTLHDCPREFELKELKGFNSYSPTIHTDYGHFIGTAIQELLRTENNLERAIVTAFAAFESPIDEISTRGQKSLSTAITAMEFFSVNIVPMLLAQGYRFWEHGIETNYLLFLTERYFFQGHIDLIVINADNELEVWEIKTSSWNTVPSAWANSSQTSGYQLILPFLAKKYGFGYSQNVKYFVQNPIDGLNPEKNLGWNIFDFQKTSLDAIEWVHTHFMETMTLDMYEENNLYPKRGSNCYRFGRNCDFFGTCDMKTFDLAKRLQDIEHAYSETSLDDVQVIIQAEEIVSFIENGGYINDQQP